jgi:hypothetical protein
MNKWLLLLCLCLLFKTQVFAGDVQQQQSVLYPYKSQIVIQDDFISASTTNGTIGMLGFGFTNGTVSQLPSVTNRPGLIRRDTSAVSGTIATLYLYPASSAFMRGNIAHDVMWMVRLNANDANTIQRLGAANSIFGVSPPNDGIYIEKLGADTNWFCVTRAGSVETRTDSSVAVNTNFNTFYYQRLENSVVFKINNTDVCTHTTNLTTALINPFTLIENSASASKTMDHDYFQLRITGMTR